MNKRRRFIMCYSAIIDGELTKRVEVLGGDYRDQVIKEICDKYNITDIYNNKFNIHVDIQKPHIKYCRELNTDTDNYQKKPILIIEEDELEGVFDKNEIQKAKEDIDKEKELNNVDQLTEVFTRESDESENSEC